MELNNRIILVTGGAGAIGGNLTQYLIKKEKCKKLIILDDLNSGFVENIPRSKRVFFVQDSILNNNILRKIFERFKIEIIFHLAANFANQNSVEHPLKDLRVNGIGTLKLLRYSQNYGVKKFIYTSSSCVYGNKKMALNEEDRRYNVDTPYAITKLLEERYVLFFNKYYNIDTTILRYFNVFGPGERPGKYRNVIPNFIHLALCGKPLIITGTGRETRDFSYIDNVIKGTILATKSDKSKGEIYNIASGKETEIVKIANLINKICRNKAGVIFKPRRKWDEIINRSADIMKAKKELGYRPLINLEKQITKTIEWFKENNNFLNL